MSAHSNTAGSIAQFTIIYVAVAWITLGLAVLARVDGCTHFLSVEKLMAGQGTLIAVLSGAHVLCKEPA